MPIARPCIECGTLTDGKTRCAACQSAVDRSRNARRVHYHGDYARRAKAVRESASVCWLCGQGPRPGDPWTADHVDAGDPASALLPAHRSCNSRRGQRTA